MAIFPMKRDDEAAIAAQAFIAAAVTVTDLYSLVFIEKVA